MLTDEFYKKIFFITDIVFKGFNKGRSTIEAVNISCNFKLCKMWWKSRIYFPNIIGTTAIEGTIARNKNPFNTIIRKPVNVFLIGACYFHFFLLKAGKRT